MPKHAERKILAHKPVEMFELVMDIAKYPEFLPWCLGSRIRKREGNLVVADLVIGFRGIRERFSSRVIGDWEKMRIDVTYENGPFRYLENRWVFTPIDKDKCEVDFYVDFEFRSALLQKMIGLIFEEAVRAMVAAFIKRADVIYNPKRDVARNSLKTTNVYID